MWSLVHVLARARLCLALLASARLGRLVRRWVDPQPLHLVNECSAWQTKFHSRSFWTAEHPTNRFQRAENQHALGVLESSFSRKSGDGQSSCRRQRIRKHAIVGKEHGTFDQVLQFANVAWPRIRCEGRHRCRRNVLDRAIHLAAINLDKMSHESRNVFATFAQRGQQARNYVQTVTQTPAKLTPVRHLHQITICGSY